MADADDPFGLSALAVHFLEERDLIRFYGDDYQGYRRPAPMISPPRLAQRKSREIAAEKRREIAAEKRREIAAEKRREIAAEKRVNASTLQTPNITNSKIRS